jgi:hypothetical protein
LLLHTSAFALIPFATEVLSHQDTHTYRLSNLLKICAAPFDSSAAEKRDYEALPTSRQAFRKVFYNNSKLPAPTPPKTPGAAEEVRII